MSTLRAAFDRLLDVGKPHGADETRARHVRTLNAAAIAGGVVAIPHGLVNVAMGAEELGMAVLATAALLVAVLAFHARTGRTRLAGQLISGLFFASVVYTSWITGGFHAPTTAWMILVPVAAGLLLSVRDGLVWLGVVAVTLVISWSLEEAGITPIQTLPAEWARPAMLGSRLAAVAIAGVIFVVFHREQTRAERSLREANTRLVEEVVERRRAEEAAQAASRAKGDFLAMISHEIRTPMNAVLGMTGLLLDTPLDARQRGFAATVRVSAESLLSILNDVLDFSKVEAGRLALEPVDFDLTEALGGTLELLRPQADAKGLTLSLEVTPGTPARWRGDVGRVRQIVLNLAGNALKFTDEGEVGVLATGMPRADGRVDLELRFWDTGPGIPTEQIERMFEPFTQGDLSTTRRFGGTGLGLAIVRRLAQAMGGEVHGEPRVGGGTLFVVRLPLDEPQAGRASTSSDPEGTPVWVEGRAPRVLVVEDNPVNQRVAMHLLERLGVTTDLAANGEEAVEMVAQVPYDAVFMDCHMPVMDGYEATRRIRAIDGPAARVPILALTADAEEENRARTLAAGMDACLTKPVTRESLREALSVAFAPRRPRGEG